MCASHAPHICRPAHSWTSCPIPTVLFKTDATSRRCLISFGCLERERVCAHMNTLPFAFRFLRPAFLRRLSRYFGLLVFWENIFLCRLIHLCILKFKGCATGDGCYFFHVEILFPLHGVMRKVNSRSYSWAGYVRDACF